MNHNREDLGVYIKYEMFGPDDDEGDEMWMVYRSFDTANYYFYCDEDINYKGDISMIQHNVMNKKNIMNKKKEKVW